MAPALSETMLAEVKLALRLGSEVYDPEVSMLIDAACEDMCRVGVDEAYVAEAGPRVRHAVVCYCKASFGYDNPEAARFDQSYRQIVIDMLHSGHNTAAAEEAPAEGEGDGE